MESQNRYFMVAKVLDSKGWSKFGKVAVTMLANLLRSVALFYRFANVEFVLDNALDRKRGFAK